MTGPLVNVVPTTISGLLTSGFQARVNWVLGKVMIMKEGPGVTIAQVFALVAYLCGNYVK